MSEELIKKLEAKKSKFIKCNLEVEPKPQTTEDKLVYLQEELDNQYRIFNKEIEKINNKINKQYKEIFTHIARIYLKITEIESKCVNSFSVVEIKENINKILEVINGRTDKRVKGTNRKPEK